MRRNLDEQAIVDRILKSGFIEEVDKTESELKNSGWTQLDTYCVENYFIVPELSEKYIRYHSMVNSDKNKIIVFVEVYTSWESKRDEEDPEYYCNYIFNKDSEVFKEFQRWEDSKLQLLKESKLIEIKLTALSSFELPNFITKLNLDKYGVSIELLKDDGCREYLSISSSLDEDPTSLKDKIVKYSNDYLQFLKSHVGLTVTDSDIFTD